MSRYAARIAAPPAKAGPPGAARQQPRPAAPQPSPLSHALQLRAAQSARSGAAPTAPSQGGLPAELKAGVEQLCGIAMDDVRVHRNSPEPAKVGALAFAQGSDIHLGPGQERHLPHEAWHVVQQKQGRVQATAQMKGVAINESPALEAEADAYGAALQDGRAMPAAGTPRAGSISVAVGPAQFKRLEPARYINTSAAKLEGEAPSPDNKATTPDLWYYSAIHANKQASRDEALKTLADIQGNIGKGYRTDNKGGTVYLSRNTLVALAEKDRKSDLYKTYAKVGKPGLVLNDLRNDPKIGLVDPILVTVGVPYGKDQSEDNAIAVTMQFAELWEGYVVGVSDSALGVGDIIRGRKAYDDKSQPRLARSGSFSSFHHKSGSESVGESLAKAPVEKSKLAYEVSVDAMCKLIAEGGRFQAVRTLGTAVSDNSIFYVLDPVKGNKGILFLDLYVNWLAFGKAYQITDDILVATLYNPPAKNPPKIKAFTADTAAATFDKDASHYNLLNGQMHKGPPVIAVPQMQQQIVIAPLAPLASSQPLVAPTQIVDPTKSASQSAQSAAPKK